MRIMLDTNILISAAVLSSHRIISFLDDISEHHTIVLSTYIVEELKRVTNEKFPTKKAVIEQFLRELPFELVYTPEKIDSGQYPDIKDKKDLPILVTAIHENIDVLLSGDNHFTSLELERPEFMTIRNFMEKYGHF